MCVSKPVRNAFLPTPWAWETTKYFSRDEIYQKLRELQLGHLFLVRSVLPKFDSIFSYLSRFLSYNAKLTYASCRCSSSPVFTYIYLQVEGSGRGKICFIILSQVLIPLLTHKRESTSLLEFARDPGRVLTLRDFLALLFPEDVSHFQQLVDSLNPDISSSTNELPPPIDRPVKFRNTLLGERWAMLSSTDVIIKEGNASQWYTKTWFSG